MLSLRQIQKQHLDLDTIIRLFPGVQYRPREFAGLVFRLKNPKTSTLIFSSGKMVCTGSIDLDKTTYSLKKTMYEPEQFPGLIYRMNEPKVVMLLSQAETSSTPGQRRKKKFIMP